jgi:hypothetical protein
MPLVMPSTNTITSKALDPDDLFAIFDAAPSTDSSNGVQPQEGMKKGHAHRKTHSLVGFDPMLETTNTEKPSHASSDSKVWSNNTDAALLINEESSSNHHPLLAGASKKTNDVSASHKSSKSVCVSDLQDIASQLSFQRPRAMTNEEEVSITLGDSTSASISKHDRKLLKKKSHRKSQSLSEMIGLIPKKTSPPPTPNTRGKALVKQPPTTPPRSTNTSTPIQSPKILKHTIASKLPQPLKHTNSKPKTELNIPTLMKQSPTSFLKDNTMAPRSSEQDPSPHQVAIPTANDLYIHSKLCVLLETYQSFDQNFDFNTLKGINSLTLKGFTTLNHSIAGMAAEQKPIVQALLDCHDDLIVEGYFGSNDDLEVGVFSMQNTYLAVYKGTAEQQGKPARTKDVPIKLDTENPVMVYAPFRDAYFELEGKVYALLDSLVEANPFSDVIFVGHSFGGALATIGAVRFASARPTLRFSCHAFGSPKVGSHDFSQLVNTLPNLKVVRVELLGDANCTYPVDHGSVKYQHAGHSIVISNNNSNKVLAYRFDAKKPNSSMSNLLRMQKPDIHAYVKALEPFASDKHDWISLYVGQDVGKGVRGKDNEKRLMV